MKCKAHKAKQQRDAEHDTQTKADRNQENIHKHDVHFLRIGAYIGQALVDWRRPIQNPHQSSKILQ
jgi:hypothetical protein